MDKTLSPELTLYLQILFTILFFAVAGIVLAVLRKAAVRPAAGPGRSLRPASSPRLLLPVSLLARDAPDQARRPSGAPCRLGAKFFRYFDAAFVFFVIFFLVRLLDGLVRLRYEKKGRPFPLPRVLHGFVLVIVYIAVALAILRAFLGFNIGPLLAGSAILTAVLGLALQGVLGNIFSGMSLHYTRSFSRGDWVKIGETEGQVVDTNWRETRLQDRASNIVVIPNTVVASQTITNFSLPDRPSAVVLPLKVDVLAPPAAVLETPRRGGQGGPRRPGRTRRRPPIILSYDELGLSYALKFWIADYGRKPAIAGEVGRLVWYKLRRRGVEIPVPVESKVTGVRARPAAGRGAGRPRRPRQRKGISGTSRDRPSSTSRRARRPASPSSRRPRSATSRPASERVALRRAGGPLPAGRGGGRLLHRRPGQGPGRDRLRGGRQDLHDLVRGRPRRHRRRDVALHRLAADGHRDRRRGGRAPRDPGRGPGFAPRPQPGPGRGPGRRRRRAEPGQPRDARRRSRTWPPGTSRRARTRNPSSNT